MADSPTKSVRIERKSIQTARNAPCEFLVAACLEGSGRCFLWFIAVSSGSWIWLGVATGLRACGVRLRAALGRQGPAFPQRYGPASACRYCEPSQCRCDKGEPLPGEPPLPTGNSEEPASGTGQSISRPRCFQFLWRRHANRSMRVRQINDGMKRLF